MRDDDFERRLGQRLRAHEARVPGVEAPDPRGLRPRRAFPWPLVAGGGVALVAGAVLGFALLGQPDEVGDPSPSAVPTASPTASVEPTGTPAASPTAAVTPPAATATAAPTPGATLTWQMTASFGEGAGPASVLDVVESGGGLVAVGVEYHAPLPNLGPTPLHTGRIWRSADGTSWEDVTPDGFGNVTLHNVVSRPDGMVVTFGTVHEEHSSGNLEATGSSAWESGDGETWSQVPTGLPQDMVVSDVEHGGRGYLALVGPPDLSGPYELWFAADAQAWELVRTVEAGARIDAGAEGFVAAGVDFGGADPQPFAVASADGREWFDAATPPPAPTGLAAFGGDWLVVNSTFEEEVSDRAAIWFSANGLEWTEHAEVQLESVPADPLTCVEFPSGLTSAGPWLVLASDLSYPCSEGGFVVHGTQRISIDGATWEALPFPAGTVGSSHSGSAVSAAVAVEGRLVLVGQSNRQAAFWIGEQP